MREKSRILIIGGTGNLGKFIAEASIQARHPTFVLVRESTFSSPDKSQVIQSFIDQGILLLQGDIYDHNSLVKAIKQVDVVISVVRGSAIPDQVKIIEAIKEAGNIKRFIPSDFGSDIEFKGAVEPVAGLLEAKAEVRRAVEAAGIPHTYIACYGFASYFVDGFAQENATSPPRDKVIILGDGNAKAIFCDDRDVATYTIQAVDDPRTLNKILHIRPAANVISLNELVALWEKKIGKTLEKIYVPEDQVLQSIRDSPSPKNFVLSLNHAVFVKGVLANCKIDPSLGVEATELYPDVKYTTIDEYLNRFI